MIYPEKLTCFLHTLQASFDLQEYLDLPEDHPTRKAALGAFRADCASIYRQRKSRFKSANFTTKGGIESLDTLATAPPAGMELEEWEKLLCFYTREDRVKRAATNKTNRSKQAVGTQGRRSISLTHDRALVRSVLTKVNHVFVFFYANSLPFLQAKHHNQKNEGPPPTWEETWASTHRLQPPEVRVIT
jgi:hypothetical protein